MPCFQILSKEENMTWHETQEQVSNCLPESFSALPAGGLELKAVLRYFSYVSFPILESLKRRENVKMVILSFGCFSGGQRHSTWRIQNLECQAWRSKSSSSQPICARWWLSWGNRGRNDTARSNGNWRQAARGEFLKLRNYQSIYFITSSHLGENCKRPIQI